MGEAFKIRMIQSFLGCKSFTWIHFEYLLQEIQSFGGEFAKVSLIYGFQSIDFWKLSADEPGIF